MPLTIEVLIILSSLKPYLLNKMLQMDFFRISIFIVLLLTVLSCKKEIGPDNSLGCVKQYLTGSFPSEDPNYNCCNCSVDWEEISSSDIPYDYLYPCLNPSNNDQLAYYKHDNTKAWFTGYEIWVVDFCNHENLKIIENALYGINWSKNDWIFYTAIDQNIYKIRSNGDSLTQITFTTGGYNRYPKISSSGNNFMYQSELNGVTNLLIQDFLSGNIDTIRTTPAISAWCWIDDERIFYTILGNDNTQDLFLFNIYTRQEKHLHQFSIQGSLDSLVTTAIPLLKENAVLWCAYKVVGKTNLSSGESSIILNAFKQEQFLSISALDNESTFMLNKRTMHQIDDCHIDSNFDFYVIDKNGKRQDKLTL